MNGGVASDGNGRDPATTPVSPLPLDALPLATCLAIGSVALLVLGVQPVLLGPLVSEGRVAESGVGLLVTVELLAMAGGSLLGTRLLRTCPARAVALGGAILLLLANAAMIVHAGLPVLVTLRGMAGIAEGLMLALPVVAIARARLPERTSALFLIAQTTLQLLAAASIPNLAFANSRADAGFLVLAAAALVGAGLAFLAPRQLRPSQPDPSAGAISPRSAAVLLAAAAYLGGIVVIWSYFGLWVTQHGHPPAVEGAAVATSLAAQVVGALVAARLGDRMNNTATIATAAVCQGLLVTALLLFGQADIAVYLFSAAFGFLWLFALPSFTGLLIEIDPRRRAALYLAAAQLTGSALLPTLAGPLVERAGVDGASWFGIAAFAVTACLIGMSRLGRKAEA
jgi:DHA1 family inner membrane transport protein